MDSTQDNLKAAFAGESQANRRYLFFADKAEKDGFSQVARLFRAVAAAETVHARNHVDAMAGIKSTRENVQAAINGEHYEFTLMYPGFIEQANTDKDSGAIRSFSLANAVEKIHHALYERALKDVETGKKEKGEAYFICQVCGNTVLSEAPEKCPICGALRKQFKKVE